MRHWQRWTRSPPAIPNMKTASEAITFILDKMDKTTEALDIYLSAIEHSDEDMRMFTLSATKSLQFPYQKGCMGRKHNRHDTACKLVQLNPIEWPRFTVCHQHVGIIKAVW